MNGTCHFSPFVALLHQFPEVLGRPKVLVEPEDVEGGVSVVVVLYVVHDGADPDGVRAQRLKVVQLGYLDRYTSYPTL